MAAPKSKRKATDVEHELASEVDPKPIEYLPGTMERIPRGMIASVFGRPGVSKSLYAAKVAADVSHTGGVIFSTMEDPLAQVARPRLEVAGANLDRVAFWMPRLPDDLDHLRRMIVAYDARLVVLDPVNSHLRARVTNDQDVRTILSPLTKLAEETQCSFLFIGHLLKRVSGTKHILEAIAGSGGGIVGASRAVYVYAENGDDTDEKVLVCAKTNALVEPVPLVFEIDAKEFRFNATVEREVPFLVKVREDESITKQKAVEWIAGGATNKKQPEKKSVASEWLVQYLIAAHEAGVEVKTNDLVEDARQNGISKATLDRAKKDVGAISLRRGGAAGDGWWVTVLPDDHPALDESIMLGFDDEDDPDE